MAVSNDSVLESAIAAGIAAAHASCITSTESVSVSDLFDWTMEEYGQRIIATGFRD